MVAVEARCRKPRPVPNPSSMGGSARRRPSFGAVEWCSTGTSQVSADPLTQTQESPFFATRGSGSSRPQSARPGTPARLSSQPFSARPAHDRTRQEVFSASSTPRRQIYATAIPGYCGHMPTKDIELCGGTFTMESMAAAAIRSRRLLAKKTDGLEDCRTHAPRFAEQLGLHCTSQLRSYQPWARQAAGVSRSMDRFRAVRP
ncbi:unnamed protein product [Effrenium voratum]|nr:unnamed protein product [Effrenium voratum]